MSGNGLQPADSKEIDDIKKMLEQASVGVLSDAIENANSMLLQILTLFETQLPSALVKDLPALRAKLEAQIAAGKSDHIEVGVRLVMPAFQVNQDGQVLEMTFSSPNGAMMLLQSLSTGYFPATVKTPSDLWGMIPDPLQEPVLKYLSELYKTLMQYDTIKQSTAKASGPNAMAAMMQNVQSVMSQVQPDMLMNLGSVSSMLENPEIQNIVSSATKNPNFIQEQLAEIKQHPEKITEMVTTALSNPQVQNMVQQFGPMLQMFLQGQVATSTAAPGDATSDPLLGMIAHGSTLRDTLLPAQSSTKKSPPQSQDPWSSSVPKRR